MPEWHELLKYDPLPPLTNSKNPAILFFTNKYLLDNEDKSVETLWELPSALKLLGKQREDGSWLYPKSKKDIRSRENYNQLETYRILGELIEKFGFNRTHLAIPKAVDFLFSFQTDEGDFRGIYGTQYSPNYSSAILECLIKAGYENDPRIEKCFTWLLSVRQDDGGWAIPIRTVGAKWLDVMDKPDIIQPVRSKPFSHLVTGVVLRAFAAHPKYWTSKEANLAGKLLVSRLLKPDKYLDRRAKDYWTKFSWPFWWTDLLSALDSLYQLGFTRDDPQIQKALDWFVEYQEESGLWNVKLLKTKDKDLKSWISLMICRTFKRYHTL